MINDHTELDAAILASIAAGNNTASLMCDQKGLMALCRTFCDNRTPEWRVMDRRLQAMRKAGRIAYDRKTGWRITEGGK